jgi:hypothetical protein
MPIIYQVEIDRGSKLNRLLKPVCDVCDSWSQGVTARDHVTSSSNVIVELGALGTGQWQYFIGLSRSKYMQKCICHGENTSNALGSVAESNRHGLRGVM